MAVLGGTGSIHVAECVRMLVRGHGKIKTIASSERDTLRLAYW